MNSDNKNNFEEILNRYIWGAQNPGDDALLNEFAGKEDVHRKSYEAVASLKSVFSNIPPWELAVMADELEKVESPTIGIAIDETSDVVSLPVKKQTRNIYLTAAALLLTIFGASFLYLNQRIKSNVLLSMGIGQCRSGSTTLKENEHLSEKQIISGPASVCDLHFLGDVKVAVRLKPDSILEFEQSPTGLNLFVKRGGLLLNLAKVHSGKDLKIFSAGYNVKILGTRLSLNQNSQESIKLNLFEGLAQVDSGNTARLKTLQDPKIQRFIPALRTRLPLLFNEIPHPLKPGEFLELKEDPDERLELKSFYQNLDSILAGALLEKDPATAFQQNAPLWKSLDSSLQNAKPKIQELLKKRKITVQAGALDAGTLWRLERQFQGLNSEQPGSRTDASEMNKNSRKLIRDGILNSIQKANEPPPQLSKITLKNGKEYIGQVKSSGTVFRLETQAGDFTIEKKELATVDPIE